MSATEPTWEDFEPNPDDNQASPPLGAPEGNYQGRHVNDTFRVLMAALYRLGAASLLASSGVFSAASMRISNLADATARTDAVTLGQVQDNAGIWAGTTTGGANAAVLTPAVALTGGYRQGQRFSCIVGTGLTNTGSMTVNISGQGEVSLRDPYGNALAGGEWRATRRHTIEHDGSVFRLVDPANWMDQAAYDLEYPIGECKVKTNTTAPTVPKGVTATWTRISSDAYFRIASGTPGTGGSLTTGGSGTLTTGVPSAIHTVDGGGGDNVPNSNHTHQIASHTHTIEPTYRSFSVWERTA